MKKKRKLLIVTLFILAIASSLAVPAFAIEGEGAITEETSIFDTLYSLASENLDKIFSLLAFIGALIVGFAYKRGLFPFVEKALGTLSATLGKLREEAEKSNLGANEFMTELKEELKASEGIIAGFGEKLTALEDKLSVAMSLNDKNESFRAVILAEVELLYEIFISSSLPQYQKDKIGEAYERMKRELSGKEG